jgi:hypothetical protein
MTSPVDYQAVLADLEGRRAQLDAAIAAIRTMMGSVPEGGQGEDAYEPDAPAGAPIPASRPKPLSGSTIQNDTFFGMSTSGAIRKFLAMTKRPQKVVDIARAVLEGGQIHARDAQTAYNNVYASLKRMRKSGEAVRIKTGEWGLAEWYANKPKGDGE